MRNVSQPTVSRIVTTLVPIVRAVLEEFVPAAEDAIEMASGRVCLVDGTITPCWSYEEHHGLWSRKHGTTGFNAQLVCLLNGNAIYISDPLPGKTHDAAAFASTPVAEIIRNSGGGIGDKGYQGSGMVTPRKKPPRGELAAWEKKYNADVSSLRAPVEKLAALSNPGGFSTLTTGARTAPITTRMMPPADCSSSRSHGVLNNVHGQVRVQLAGIYAQEGQDQAGRDGHRGHEAHGDCVPDPPTLIRAALDALDRGQLRADRAAQPFEHPPGGRPAVTALLARLIDLYRALWKLSTRSDGTSSPRSAEASTL